MASSVSSWATLGWSTSGRRTWDGAPVQEVAAPGAGKMLGGFDNSRRIMHGPCVYDDIPMSRHGTGAAASDGWNYVPSGADLQASGAIDTHTRSRTA